MITLYKNKKYIKNNDNLVYFVDLYFNSVILDKIVINSKDIYFIEKIDHSKYVGNNFFLSSFGKTSLDNLSTGCKALILLNHSVELGNPIINVSECGPNALYFVFLFDNVNILLSFYSIPLNFDKIKNKIITVIGTKGIDMSIEKLYSKDWT